ncbi:hypothetical protein [Bacteriovorax sp. Seq25_V]|uniref:hypothetical protein n=1 Tax=Bacteriovorax sp. Seq25_V TaxID=1201288 RepID=UPI00038A1CEC|nr:hypothetical protein [Bacteriovorax sp. Seq25_V]EQC43517.1 putative membrane protein [Bacteriovorax sp. Seq25_V]
MKKSVFIVLATLFFFLIMPKSFYAGDAYAIKLSANNFAKTGSLGIDYSYRNVLYPLLENKGQYFFENDTKKKFFHRWGQLNTIIYAIPEYLNPDDSIHVDSQTVLFHNIFQLLLFSIFLTVLLKTLENLGFKRNESILYVALVSFSTVTFQYIRVQSYEFLQLLFFTCFFSTLERFKNTNKNWYRILYNIFFIMMVFTKSVLFLSCLFVIPYLGIKNIKRYLPEIIILCSCVLLYYIQQNYLYGTTFPIRTAHPSNPDEVDFSLVFFKDRFLDYFILPKRSLYTYFPLMVTALMGVKLTLRNNKPEFIFLTASFIILMIPNLFFHTYGDWCLGPRYILFILPLMSFPAIYILRKRIVRNISIGVGLVYFVLYLSYSMNDPHFAYRLSAISNNQAYLSKNQLLLSIDMLKTSEHPLLKTSDDLIFLDELHCDYYFSFLCITY